MRRPRSKPRSSRQSTTTARTTCRRRAFRRCSSLLRRKMRDRNRLPVGRGDEVMVTSGGIHGIFAVCQALLEPGDEVLLPDPCWPPAAGIIQYSHAVPVGYPLHESLGWRPDIDEMRRLITAKTRAIYVNSPSNPTGGVLTRRDLEHIARSRPRAGSVGDLRRGVRRRRLRRTSTSASRRCRACTRRRFPSTRSARRTR